MRKFNDHESMKIDEEAVEPEEPNNHEEPKPDQYLPAIEDLNTGPETKIKKLLKRADSDYDLTLKTWIRKD